MVLLGVARDDAERDAEYIADKVANLRIFPDDEGRMNLSVKETTAAVMVVSQFTLLGDCRRGRRPSFMEAAAPDLAERLYQGFMESLINMGISVRSGLFGEMMEVELVNTGPVTLVISSPRETDRGPSGCGTIERKATGD